MEYELICLDPNVLLSNIIKGLSIVELQLLDNFRPMGNTFAIRVDELFATFDPN